MADIKLQADKREGKGKNKVDKLRAESLVPGVVYAKALDNRHIQFTEREFKLMLREAGMTTIVDLVIDGESIPVLVKDIQYHPYKNQVLHVDFQEIKMDETIKLAIPIRLLNREDIQLKPSILIQVLDELDIECLPMDIPDLVEYDVSSITFDEPVTVKDLDIFNDDKITIFDEADDIVATLNHPQEEEEEEEELEELDVDAADVPTVSETEEDEVEEVEEEEE